MTTTATRRRTPARKPTGASSRALTALAPKPREALCTRCLTWFPTAALHTCTDGTNYDRVRERLAAAAAEQERLAAEPAEAIEQPRARFRLRRSAA